MAAIRTNAGSRPGRTLNHDFLAIGVGGLNAEDDDHQLLEKGSFVYDALYAWCLIQTGSGTN